MSTINTEYRYDFASVDSKIPMIEFIESLNLKEQAKIKANIDKLVELLNQKNYPNEKLSKYLSDGIFELRVKFINRISRSFYFFMDDKMIIFTHGYIKKTEKTDSKEIEKAKQIKAAYRGRK